MRKLRPGPRPGTEGRPVTRPDAVSVHLRLSAGLKALLEAEARARGVSASRLAEELLTDLLRPS